MPEPLYASLSVVALFLCFTNKCCLWPDVLLVWILLQPIWLTVKNFFYICFKHQPCIILYPHVNLWLLYQYVVIFLVASQMYTSVLFILCILNKIIVIVVQHYMFIYILHLAILSVNFFGILWPCVENTQVCFFFTIPQRVKERWLVFLLQRVWPSWLFHVCAVHFQGLIQYIRL